MAFLRFGKGRQQGIGDVNNQPVNWSDKGVIDVGQARARHLGHGRQIRWQKMQPGRGASADEPHRKDLRSVRFSGLSTVALWLEANEPLESCGANFSRVL